MKQFKILLGLFLLIVILSGCTNNTKTNEVNFEVGIDEIKNVKINEAFEISGYLKNISNRTVDISHGSGMFTYEIYNEDGGQIIPDSTILFRNDIGYSSKIKSNDEYRNNGEEQRSKEYFQFLIQKPGVYSIKTNVEFGIVNKENQFQVNMSSDLKSFTVE